MKSENLREIRGQRTKGNKKGGQRGLTSKHFARENYKQLNEYKILQGKNCKGVRQVEDSTDCYYFANQTPLWQLLFLMTYINTLALNYSSLKRKHATFIYFKADKTAFKLPLNWWISFFRSQYTKRLAKDVSEGSIM